MESLEQLKCYKIFADWKDFVSFVKRKAFSIIFFNISHILSTYCNVLNMWAYLKREKNLYSQLPKIWQSKQWHFHSRCSKKIKMTTLILLIGCDNLYQWSEAPVTQLLTNRSKNLPQIHDFLLLLFFINSSFFFFFIYIFFSEI